MCGISGEINFNQGVKVDSMKRMCNVLAHRGPDDEGMVFIKNGQYCEVKEKGELPSIESRFQIALGHRRLSIIDLSSAAHQPMCNEDGTVWIVYNGEIYNFQGIKRELESKGHLFKSKSDTEVILHAYEEWDVRCLDRFRGMFAFAIWDSNLKRLFAARDRLGKKPLVYYCKNGRFIFGSEIKAILQTEGINREVNISALHDYLTYQYVPSPETMFENIKKLPPAHYLLYHSSGDIKIERYWKLSFSSDCQAAKGISNWDELIQNKLEESVKLRLISDVPLGAFLSGGIDSSLIVGMMVKYSEKPVKTFSIGFEEKGFDELGYARLVSKHFSTEHHEFIVKPNAIEVLPKLVWYYNEPFADSSVIPTYYVSSMTKDFVKVVLTGDAGDENFAGYPRYLRSKWVASFTKIPEKLRREFLPAFLRMCRIFHWKVKTLNRLADFMEVLSIHQGMNYAEQIKIFNEKEKIDLYTKDLAMRFKDENHFAFLLEKYEEIRTEDLVEKLLYVDINSYLPEDLLVKMDIATMANSIEARIPFLDHQFMEVVAGIPSHFKLKRGTTKFILKKAFSKFLPEVILNRKKMGFGVPVSRWFREELKDYVYGILLDKRTLNRGYFREASIEHVLNEHMSLQYDHSAQIWALLVLEIWFRIFIDREEDFFPYAV